MKINNIKKVEDLQDGEVFYCFPDWSNNDFMGTETDVLMTGNDMIHIADDCGQKFEGLILVNGGIELRLQPEDKVYILGHYSELLNNFGKVLRFNRNRKVISQKRKEANYRINTKRL